MVYIQVDAAKKILESDEQTLAKYQEICEEFEKIKSEEDYNWYEFKEVVRLVAEGKSFLLFKCRIEYKEFAKKYKTFIKKFFNNSFTHPMTYLEMLGPLFQTLKQDYSNYAKLLSMFNKLSELKITSFCFDSQFELDGNYKVVIPKKNDRNIEGIATDGHMTFNASYSHFMGQSTIYPVTVEDAKYVLTYKKYQSLQLPFIDLKVKDLLFDTETLPTYGQLYDFEVLPYVNYEEAEYNTNLSNQKRQFISELGVVDDAINITNRLLMTLQQLTGKLKYTKDLEETKAIARKIKLIMGLCTDIDSIKQGLVDEAVSKEFMSEDEIAEKLQKRKGYYIGHCDYC